MNRKKILFVINSLNCGGAERSLVSLLSLMDYNRYEVHLQMFSRAGMFLKLLPEQVRVLPELTYQQFCRTRRGPLRWHLARLRTSVGLRLKPKCGGLSLHTSQLFWKYSGASFEPLETAYDVAIAWGQGNPTHFVAEKVSAKRKIAVANSDLERGGYNRFFDRRYYEQYDCIAAVSDKLRPILAKTYPSLQDRIVTLYDIRNQSLITAMAEEYEPYTREEGIPVLVTVGRIAQAKGYDLAVEAGALLKERGTVFRWYLVGDGPERTSIRKMIEDKGLSDSMFSVGAKENPYPYIKHADVYVQTSRFEGYCLTLSEARGLHTPPVSTDFNVVHDQLRHGENGLIVAMTPEAIADGIETMLRDDTLRESIRNTLRRERVGNEEEIETFYRLVEGAL